MTMQPSAGTALVKFWPIFIVIGMVIGAAYVGQRDIGANAGDINENRLDIDELENRVIVESKATSLALQELRIKQEIAIVAQRETAKKQDDKLDAILRSVLK